MAKRALYWIPRILTILAILFMLMFSFDSFGGNESAGRQLIGFLINSIPVFILAVILILAWKWELAGGVLFIIAFIGSCIFFGSFSGNSGSLIVTTPILITGLLFILYHLIYKRKQVTKN